MPAIFTSDNLLTIQQYQCGEHCIQSALISPSDQCPYDCYHTQADVFIPAGDRVFADRRLISDNCLIELMEVTDKKLSRVKCLETPESFKKKKGWYIGLAASGDDHLLGTSYNPNEEHNHFTGDIWFMDTNQSSHQALAIPNPNISTPRASTYSEDNGVWFLFEQVTDSDNHLCHYDIDSETGELINPVCSTPQDGIYNFFFTGEEGEETLALSANGFGLLSPENYRQNTKTPWQWFVNNPALTDDTIGITIPTIPPFVHNGTIYQASHKVKGDNQWMAPVVNLYNQEDGSHIMGSTLPYPRDYQCNRVIAQPVLDTEKGLLHTVVSYNICPCYQDHCDLSSVYPKHSKLLTLNASSLSLVTEKRLSMYARPMVEIDKAASKLYINDDGSKVALIPATCYGDDSPDHDFFHCSNREAFSERQSYLLLAFRLEEATIRPSSCQPVASDDCHQVISMIPVITDAVPVTSAPQPTSATAQPTIPNTYPDADGSSILILSLSAAVPWAIVVTVIVTIWGIYECRMWIRRKRYHLLGA